jgi:iron(III) transport system substrate-binding protein
VDITSTNETFIYVPKGAPNPAAAVLLSSFLSSEEAQDALAQHYNSRIPRNTDCSDPKQNKVVETLCSEGIKWSSTGTLGAYNSLTDYFPEIQKALGTYTG